MLEGSLPHDRSFTEEKAMTLILLFSQHLLPELNSVIK